MCEGEGESECLHSLILCVERWDRWFAPNITTCMFGMGTVIHYHYVWEAENESMYKLILCQERRRETRLALINKTSVCVGR